jgi:hypothetical protein
VDYFSSLTVNLLPNGQRLYRTRITPEADAPSEHLTDRMPACRRQGFEQIGFIIKINPCLLTGRRFNPLNPFDPCSILLLLVLACPC